MKKNMEKLKMQSPDITQQNIEKLLALFPNCKTEKQDDDGNLTTGIDFDLLKQELSKNIVEGPQERYQLNWPGKKEALLTANAPIAKTLRPCREESVDFDTTENLFIEGDNLDAIKLLQETYLGKVKMIYIDPPYNTGKDFIYADNFAESTDEYLMESGQTDDEGNRLVANTESNGRFHSDWLTMMYSRLKLSKNLLRDDGIIFISIDNCELSNLSKLCDEIFGEDNCRGVVSRATGTPSGQGYNILVNEVDYLLVYAKSASANLLGLPFNESDAEIYNQKDDKGRYLTRTLRKTGGEDRKEDRPTMFYGITAPDGSVVFPIGPTGYQSRWRCGQKAFEEFVLDERIEWKHADGQYKPYLKFYLDGRTKQPSNLWQGIEGNKKASLTVKSLFGKKVFDAPKPLELLSRCIQISTNDDDLILDYFSGSGTTAHSVMQQNSSISGSKRRFICVQMAEGCNQKSEAFKAGYKTIAEISKERIRRAGQKIKEENPETTDLDTGFHVLKIDSSNMNDVHYTPDAVSKDDLFNQVEHIKTDRTGEDLLFQVMLDWGIELSLPIRKETIVDKEVFFVNDDDLIACFDKQIDEALIKTLAAKEPLRVVFRDDGFISDSVKINVEQIFKQLAPATDIKAI